MPFEIRYHGHRRATVARSNCNGGGLPVPAPASWPPVPKLTIGTQTPCTCRGCRGHRLRFPHGLKTTDAAAQTQLPKSPNDLKTAVVPAITPAPLDPQVPCAWRSQSTTIAHRMGICLDQYSKPISAARLPEASSSTRPPASPFHCLPSPTPDAETRHPPVLAAGRRPRAGSMEYPPP